MSPERPGSGENVFLDGLAQWELCIGDVFGASDGGCRLEVSSPRRPCENWNIVHGREQEYTDPTGAGNVRHLCLQQTLGGFFFRILQGGELRVGATLTLLERPYPEWSLKRLGDQLYSTAEVDKERWAQWLGAPEELAELIAMPQLAMTEWKEELLALRDANAERGV
jgi:MOSC domain-containing protein YiiM